MSARLVSHPRSDDAFGLHDLRGVEDGAAYRENVARAVEYIRAGDCYQVNLAHQLRAGFDGTARGLASAMIDSADPWFGAYLEIDHAGHRHAAACASPELLLRFDATTRRAITRPIKGTRPGAGDPRGLERSIKDQAELNMIVDLMRNDLGRAAEFGSVSVDEARTIEHHAAGGATGGVFHGVATVSARVRSECSLIDVLGACFPGGSVTGAPKLRAMQIIDELESEARGLYTGSIGFISDSGDVQFNIAIRPEVLRGAPRAGAALDQVDHGEVRFGVGAGIVADSTPDAEWLETLDKAGVFLDRFAPVAAKRPEVAPPNSEQP